MFQAICSSFRLLSELGGFPYVTSSEGYKTQPDVLGRLGMGYEETTAIL